MDEVLPEAALFDFSLEVFIIIYFSFIIDNFLFLDFSLLSDEVCMLITIIWFQAAHAVVKQYIDSTFSHLLLDIPGQSRIIF